MATTATAPPPFRAPAFGDRERSIIRTAESGLVEVVINDIEHFRLFAERASILDATPTG
jgi:hypothetical protein